MTRQNTKVGVLMLRLGTGPQMESYVRSLTWVFRR